MRPNEGKYDQDNFKVMLSVKGSMGCLSCNAQVCLEVTQKYGALMVEEPRELDHVYRLCLR